MVMQKTIGFLGAGRMSEAIIRGLVKRNFIPANQIYASDPNGRRMDAFKDLGINMVQSNSLVVRNCDYVIICVKPLVVSPVIQDLKRDDVDMNKVFISVAAGLKLSTLESFLTGTSKIIRVMPNTPSFVGEGVSAYAPNDNVTQDEADYCHAIFGSIGLSVAIAEKHMDAVTGLSGSGPAYVFMFIEAMADAGVRNGLPRELARQMAAQTVYGSAKMALDTPQIHLAELRNNVESAGGATILASASLERNCFRHAVIEAVNTSTDKSIAMSKTTPHSS